MNDKEFIIFLCKQILDIKTIERELRSRNINPDDIFIY